MKTIIKQKNGVYLMENITKLNHYFSIETLSFKICEDMRLLEKSDNLEYITGVFTKNYNI